MSIAAAQPDHRTLPRKKRPPSGRDQAIYLARMTRGCTQEQLAKDFQLSQPRVSQILRRVEAWRGGYGPQAAGELDHAARQRLERHLARERFQGIYDRAIRQFDAAPTELTAKKNGERDGQKYSEESRRDVPPPAQLLRIALRAGEDLQKLADQPAPPPPQDQEAEQSQRQSVAIDWLYQQRREAEDAGKVARSREHQSDNYCHLTTVEHWLGALLGEAPQWRASPIHFGPGTPLAELSRFYYPQEPAEALTNLYNPNVNETSQVVETPQLGAEEPGEMTAWQYERGIATYTQIAHDPERPEASRDLARRQLARLQAHLQRLGGSGQRSCPQPGSGPAHPAATSVPPQAVVRPLEPQPPDAAERRRLHQQKLEQLQAARRRGLPIQFEFDPADGPLPPVYYHVDGVDYP